MNEWILGGESESRLIFKAIIFDPSPNSFDLLSIYIDFLIVTYLICDFRHYFTSRHNCFYGRPLTVAGFEPCSAQLSHDSESKRSYQLRHPG